MRIEEELLGALRAAQEEIVQGMINFPAEELNQHFRQVGRYQGLEKAVEILTTIVSGSEADED